MNPPGRRTLQVLYLHGFASSARSTKASYFADRLRLHGITQVTPDFNLPDFRTLTMTRMLGQVMKQIDELGSTRVTLIGSSLGGALAVLAGSRLADRVETLVLLAPALLLARRGRHLLPPDRIERWRAEGAAPFFHHAYNEERLLDFAFYEDTLRHDPFAATFPQPTLIFQGLEDTAVEPGPVEEFAQGRKNVRLRLLDDDHQLVRSLPLIWREVEAFLELGEREGE